MEIRRNHLLQGQSTIWRSREERSCLKTSCILKTIIRVFGISSATSPTRDLQKKTSARSWMKTRSQESRPLQQFHQCCNLSHKPQDRSNRKRQSGRESLADKSYAGKEAQYFDGVKKLAAKFHRATVVLVLNKHTDALIINLDMHQFLRIATLLSTQLDHLVWASRILSIPAPLQASTTPKAAVQFILMPTLSRVAVAI